MTLKRYLDGGPSLDDGVFVKKRFPGAEFVTADAEFVTADAEFFTTDAEVVTTDAEVVTADAVKVGIRVAADESPVITPVVIDVSAGDGAATAAIFGVNDSAPQILGRRRRF